MKNSIVYRGVLNDLQKLDSKMLSKKNESRLEEIFDALIGKKIEHQINAIPRKM